MGRSGQGLVTNVCASRLAGPEQRWFWLSSENGGVADLKKMENRSQLSRESIRFSKELFGWWKACQSLWMKLKISHRCVVLVGVGGELRESLMWAPGEEEAQFPQQDPARVLVQGPYHQGVSGSNLSKPQRGRVWVSREAWPPQPKVALGRMWRGLWLPIDWPPSWCWAAATAGRPALGCAISISDALELFSWSWSIT